MDTSGAAREGAVSPRHPRAPRAAASFLAPEVDCTHRLRVAGCDGTVHPGDHTGQNCVVLRMCQALHCSLPVRLLAMQSAHVAAKGQMPRKKPVESSLMEN